MYLRRGNGAEAHACLDESFKVYGELQDVRGAAEFLHELAGLLPVSFSTVQLLGAAQTLNADTAAAPFPDQTAQEQARTVLGEAVFERAWATGSLMTLAQAVEVARKLLAHESERISLYSG